MAEPHNERDLVGSGGARDEHTGPGAVNENRTAASGIAAELKDRASEVKAKAYEQAKELKATAAEKTDELKTRAAAKVEEEKFAWGIRVQALARALHDAGNSLERDGEAGMARWGYQAAEQVERLGGYLDKRDFNGLVGDLETTARDNPGTFVGGSFAAGLLVARFLRASRPEPEATQALDKNTEENAAAKTANRPWQSNSPQSMTAAPRRSASKPGDDAVSGDDRSGHGGTHV